MSGLIKPKKYDWKDSNLALFGSDTEKKVKKASAESEPAWKNAGKEVGIQIWRIVNFKVTHWPKDDYGKFFGGDSYIILKTYKPDPKSETLAFNLHFWIGSTSTQDEYGTAAYKTVELDTYLDDVPIQHREVQGHESELFQSYFPKGIIIMEGGAESGFRHVTPTSYKPRLLHVRGERKHVVVNEVPLARSRIRSDDVFILDLGNTLYQFNGSGSNKDERFKGMQVLNNIRSERPKTTAETLEEGDMPQDHPFYSSLTEPDVDDSAYRKTSANQPTQLYRVSDAAGKLQMSKVKDGSVSYKDMDPNISSPRRIADNSLNPNYALESRTHSDVFIVDTGKHCFVWVGSGASPAERKNGFSYAHNHLMKTPHPLIPIVVVKQGQKNADFQAAIAA